MDWLRGMNRVIDYIEKNLTQIIQLESLALIVGCSVYCTIMLRLWFLVC